MPNIFNLSNMCRLTLSKDPDGFNRLVSLETSDVSDVTHLQNYGLLNASAPSAQVIQTIGAEYLRPLLMDEYRTIQDEKRPTGYKWIGAETKRKLTLKLFHDIRALQAEERTLHDKINHTSVDNNKRARVAVAQNFYWKIVKLIEACETANDTDYFGREPKLHAALELAKRNLEYKYMGLDLTKAIGSALYVGEGNHITKAHQGIGEPHKINIYHATEHFDSEKAASHSEEIAIVMGYKHKIPPRKKSSANNDKPELVTRFERFKAGFRDVLGGYDAKYGRGIIGTLASPFIAKSTNKKTVLNPLETIQETDISILNILMKMNTRQRPKKTVKAKLRNMTRNIQLFGASLKKNIQSELALYEVDASAFEKPHAARQYLRKMETETDIFFREQIKRELNRCAQNAVQKVLTLPSLKQELKTSTFKPELVLVTKDAPGKHSLKPAVRNEQIGRAARHDILSIVVDGTENFTRILMDWSRENPIYGTFAAALYATGIGSILSPQMTIAILKSIGQYVVALPPAQAQQFATGIVYGFQTLGPKLGSGEANLSKSVAFTLNLAGPQKGWLNELDQYIVNNPSKFSAGGAMAFAMGASIAYTVLPGSSILMQQLAGRELMTYSILTGKLAVLTYGCIYAIKNFIVGLCSPFIYGTAYFTRSMPLKIVGAKIAQNILSATSSLVRTVAILTAMVIIRLIETVGIIIAAVGLSTAVLITHVGSLFKIIFHSNEKEKYRENFNTGNTQNLPITPLNSIGNNIKIGMNHFRHWFDRKLREPFLESVGSKIWALDKKTRQLNARFDNIIEATILERHEKLVSNKFISRTSQGINFIKNGLNVIFRDPFKKHEKPKNIKVIQQAIQAELKEKLSETSQSMRTIHPKRVLLRKTLRFTQTKADTQTDPEPTKTTPKRAPQKPSDPYIGG